MKKLSLLVLFTFFLLGGCSSQPASQVPVKQNVNVQPPVAVNQDEPKKAFEFRTKVSADKLDERINNYVADNMLKNTLKGHSFMLNSFPFADGMILLGSLNESYSKRYTDEQIKNEFVKLKRTAKSTLGFAVVITSIGGYSDTSDMTLDDNTYEYFFIENDKGDYIRAIGQDPLEIGSSFVNMYAQGKVMIYFNPDEVAKLAKNSINLFLAFDGIKIATQGKNKIKLQYPFNLYYQKEFPEVDSMLEDINNATK